MERSDEPRDEAWDRKDFPAHALTYALVMVLLVTISALITPVRYFWPMWPMLGWGFAVVAHGLSRAA